MTVAEIFSKLADHMIKGLMIHESLANYYEYLNLHGYSHFHEKQYREESKSYRNLNLYYIKHYRMMIPESKPDTKLDIIPSEFYGRSSLTLETRAIRQYVKMGLEKWVKWETDTKTLYQEMYSELIAIKEIASAMFIEGLIADVDEELCKAQSYLMTKQTVDYDILSIVDEQ